MRKTLISLPLSFFCLSGAFVLSSAFAAPPVAAQTDPSNLISIGDVTIVEGNGTYRELAFPVSMTRAQPRDVNVKYSTRDISAKAPGDYTPLTLNQITIKAGQTKANIIVRVTGDRTEERDETFLVQLARPTGVVIGDADGTGTIKDDDYAGRISISDVTVPEFNTGQKVAKTQVTFSQAPLHDITVNYETKDDSAKASLGDYVTTKGSLVFRPGRLIFTVAVPIIGDTVVESNEKFFVKISATGYTIAKSFGTVSITNDDSSQPMPPSGKIVFASQRDGNQEIYVMNASGTNQTRLTNNGVRDFDPSFSADGSKIAFVSFRDGNDEIYTMNADGSNQRRLTDSASSDYNASFSPDGQKIVFVSNRNRRGNGQIFVMNADGSNPVPLVTNDNFDSYNPSFSADGTKITFVSSRDGNNEIYIMNADGSGQTRLTNSSNFDNNPDISPNGQSIAYSVSSDTNSEIFVMNADGTNQVALTSTATPEFYPRFSPDGTRIAFSAGFDGSSDVFIMNSNGTGQTKVTTTGSDSQPWWAPGSVPAPTSATPALPPAPSAPSA